MPMAPPAPWQRRLVRIVTIAQWIALAIGIIAAVFSSNASVASLVASGLAGIYVAVSTALPLRHLARRFVLETVTLVGAALTMAAVTLTGATESPFVLLSLTPSIMATVLGGLRVGIASALLSGSLLMMVSLAQQQTSIAGSLGFAGLYLVVAATVAQAQRILQDMAERTAQLEASSQEARRRLEDLEAAHGLLTRLAHTANRDISATAIGRTALEELESRYPGSAGTATIVGEEGPVIVAAYGERHAGRHTTRIPLRVGDREVGDVVLTTAEALGEDDLERIETTLRPVALAFANVLLLQDIARRAIEEERLRLARELHDEIGPSLASLGLALDVAMVQSPAEPALSEHLRQLRGNVGRLVDEVRATVADLRTGRSGSLRSRLESLAATLGDSPKLVVDLDERRPPRPSAADEIAAILGEAIRNAHRHSGGTTIRVHGWTDYDRGHVVVEDDGDGFSPEAVPAGHFGVMGMRERAAKAGLALTISSGAEGTRVSISWGE